MSRYPAAWTILAGVHLALVVCGAADLWRHAPDVYGLDSYGMATGADYGYGFFAPQAAPEPRVTSDLIGPDGATWTATLGTGTSREADLRLGNVASFLFKPAQRRDIAASLATALFARHPSAVQVTVKLETFDPPTMSAF